MITSETFSELSPIVQRAMTLEDLESVFAIECLAHSHPWSIGNLRDCITSGYHCQVLEQDGDIVAFGVISAAIGESHLLNLVVSPNHQRQGLGQRLLNQLLKAAVTLDAEVMFLEVRASNQGAITLYLENGFSEIGRRKDYYPAKQGREEAIVMVMDLTFLDD
ncbi:ribosomal protein S18-alanine N-acetyltransferase [Kistimonas scapharcae]|uniref:[Ribosomal protein bS18]-alanine N-acetyltransferase n=1 Tax=Kistimonas scapharcae TaxID=1036133 RepID=A0ABP8V7S5_9GAMM